MHMEICTKKKTINKIIIIIKASHITSKKLSHSFLKISNSSWLTNKQWQSVPHVYDPTEKTKLKRIGSSIILFKSTFIFSP